MPNSNQQLLNDIEKIATSVNDSMKQMQEELKDSNIQLASLKTKFDNLQSSLTSVSKIVKDGNGETSLVTKVALLQQEVFDAKQWLKAIEGTNIESRISSLEEWKKDIKKWKEDTIQKLCDNCKIYKQAVNNRLTALEKWKISVEIDKKESVRMSWRIKLAIITGILAGTSSIGLLAKEVVKLVCNYITSIP